MEVLAVGREEDETMGKEMSEIQIDMKSVWKALDKIKDPMIRAFIEKALQDQAEREKGCEYCNPEVMDGNPIFSRHADGYLGSGKFCTDAGVGVKAYFCPHCGRDLRKPVSK